VFQPVAEKVWVEVGPAFGRGDATALLAAGTRAAEPVKQFLERHTPERERRSFLELQRQLRGSEAPQAVVPRDLMVLLPAFAASELRAAFQVGFLLLLPFLVID